MIIIGYQGIGKSTLAGQDKCIDLESTNFYIYGTKPEGWHEAYCRIAADLSDQGYRVFTSSHAEVRRWLGENSNEWTCVCRPSLSLKDEWIKKLKDRFDADPSDKNRRALQNAVDRYEDNIREIDEDARKYDFDIIEIDSMDYSLKDLIYNFIWRKK